MQRMLFAALALSIGQTVHAQAQANTAPPVSKEGKVIYERKVNLHRRLTDESMKSMVPEFNTSKTELDFSAGESIYKNIKEEEDIRDHAGEDNNRAIIRLGGGDDQVYKNYTLEKITEQRELG